MKVLKYSKDNADFTIELRKTVKEYFIKNNIQQYGNTEIIVKTIFMSVLYFVPFALIVTGNFSSVVLVLACWIVMGIGTAGLGMATMHDANHGSFSKHKWVNRMFGRSLYLLGGFPPNWKFQHNTLHHGYPNVDGYDEDIAPVGILRFSPHQPLKKIHKYQYIYAWFFYSLMTISWITVKDFKRLFNYHQMGAVLSGNKSFNRLLFDLILSKLFYYGIFLVIPIIFSSVSWYWIVAGFLFMHITSGLILSTIFQTAHVVPSSSYPLPEENKELNNNWTVHQLYTTADFSPRSSVFSWLIGGLNYQVIHHLFPNVSHIHYKRLAPIVQSTAEKYGLPYHSNKSFSKAIYEHTKMLKILGEN